jgi:UDP-glucose 4-epimerase
VSREACAAGAVTSDQGLAGRTVLVTGASGFLGTHLCRRLRALGADVHGVSRVPRHGGGIRWWRADLADEAAVRELVRAVGPQLIVHLASHVSGARALELVSPTFSGNLASTVRLLTLATELGCRRLLVVGSSEEPGGPEATPSSPYAAAKWAAGAYARMFHRLYRTPVVIARVFMTYGPGQKDLTKLVPYVIGCLLRGETAKLSSGQRRVDWIYVDDVIEGLVAAAQAADVDGCTIDLGSGSLVAVRAVVEQLVRAVGGPVAPAFGALPDRPFEPERAADLAPAAARLGWKPTMPLDEGLAHTVAWYRRCLAGSGRRPAEEETP